VQNYHYDYYFNFVRSLTSEFAEICVSW